MSGWLISVFVLLTLVSLSSIVFFPTSMAAFAYVVPILFLFIAIGAFLLLLLHYAYSLLEVKKDLVVGALGLPEGSVRAFLTIGLLALVAVFGTFIYFESGKSTTYPIVRADVPVASPEELTALINSVGDKFVVIPKGKTAADVVSATPDATRADIAKQLLTMITTVLTTVIGFYFGTSAATAGAAASSSAAGGPTPPPGPVTFDPGSGRPGDRVKISGTGFGTAKGTVSFGDVPADMAGADWADREVTVSVPVTAKPGKVKVTLMPAGSERKLVSTADFDVLEGGAAPGVIAAENSVDGCDVAVTDETKDRDLPAAEGGIQR